MGMATHMLQVETEQRVGDAGGTHQYHAKRQLLQRLWKEQTRQGRPRSRDRKVARA
jgi:hypothetical protein